jgi:hypothetical protein
MSISKPQQFWTVEERATAMQLAKKGATAAAIGAAIGRTRNSVIGWLHRAGLGLQGKPTPKRPTRTLTKPVERRAKPKPPARPRFAAGYAYMTGANPMPPAPLPKREPLPPLGNLMTATATQCRWIDTAPAICGRDTKSGSSYCPHHHSIVYVRKGAAVAMTDEEKRKEILAHIEATYRPPDDAWMRRFFILQVQRAGPKELTDMLRIVRSKKNDTP